MPINNTLSLELSAYSSAVLNTLENLIAPGGRARLSPYVEAAQLHVLFGILPSPKNRIQDIFGLIQGNEDRIWILAKGWSEFCNSGKSFRNNDYAEEDFLEAYLIYYSSVNIAKIQINLLDLVREGEIKGNRFEIADIGVGAGTSAVAVLDFLFAWRTVCNLYEVDFPVKSLSLHGLDYSSIALNFADRFVRGYVQALKQRAESLADSSLNIFMEAAEKAQWNIFNLEKSTKLPQEISPTIVIISNVLSELSSNGQNNLAETIKNLPQETVALISEPGDEAKANALMQWRNGLLRSELFSRTGPCGQELLHLKTRTCTDCWNGRRQSFHQTSLYLAFRKAAEKFLPDKRSYDDFSNNLLSWSCVWVKRGENLTNQNEVLATGMTDSVERQSTMFRFIGQYRNNMAVDPDPDNSNFHASTGWKEFIKYCPMSGNRSAFSVERPAGYFFPPVRYGQTVLIENGICTPSSDCTPNIVIDSNTKITTLNDEGPNSAFLSNYSDITRSAVNEIGYRLFGFASMHPFQHRIIERVLIGKSVFGIAATGSGKSECFILPSMLLPGVTVVISPLVSLMMDQYDQRITERYGLNHLATYINGQVPFKERQARLRRLEMGYYKLVYFTPEQLERSYILDTLRRANEHVGVRYLAMDEAHCISQWGHDFRPSYLNISRRMKDYGLNPIRIALTATASPYVRNDVCEELGLDSRLLDDGGEVFIESSNRSELNLIVRVKRTTDEKISSIVSDLRKLFSDNKYDQSPGSAIVFLPTTGGDPDSVYPTDNWTLDRGKHSTGVTHFAAYLERSLNKRVTIYHSKMDMELDTEANSRITREPGDLRGRSRRSEQHAFIKGETPIMVATKGFGMGIDKDNVRLIIHRTPPLNLEAYAQEAGRAGRDGSLADVILYYSPDAPEEDNGFGKVHRERSDYDIQKFFLSEKYIRRQDVLVMRAFLKTVAHRIGNNLYFTNDEAIQFFNRCIQDPALARLDEPFEWPKIPPRRNFGRETPEHIKILDKGYTYQCQTSYLDRIIQALYRIRPDLDGIGLRYAFLEQVQETGATIKNPRVLHSQAIIISNAYFGRIFDRAGICADELKYLIENGDLFPIASKLSLSIYETASLLYDIRSAENNYGKPELLDFSMIAAPKYGPAAEIFSLSDWRLYAGAFERANTPEVYARATKAGRKKLPKSNGKGYYPETTLDDWFSAKELNKPRGWEIFPGSAFYIDDQFDDFLRAFMALHDQRKENDENAYKRLLTRYVGVDENGQIPFQQSNKTCLRSVLLGYLETYELISGDNCYSCSRCVEDGNFGKYSIEDRRSVVVHMVPAISVLFDRFKDQGHSLPSSDDVKVLFDYIESEEKAGRSLRGYFGGWLPKLLDQMPNHLSALWLQMEGMVENILSFEPNEFIQNADILRQHLENLDLQRLERIIRISSEKCKDDASYRLLRANIARKLGNYDQETSLLLDLLVDLKKRPSAFKQLLYTIVVRLIELQKTDGPDPESMEKTLLSLLAGRTASSEDVSRKWYAPIVQNWTWKEVLEELDAQSHYHSSPNMQAALLLTWANEIESRWMELGQWFAAQPEIIAQWPEADQTFIYNHLQLDVLVSTPKMAQQAMLVANESERIIRLGIKLWENGESLTPAIRHRIAEKMMQAPKQADFILKTISGKAVNSLFSSLNSEIVEFVDWAALEAWLDLQPMEMLTGEYALQWLRNGVRLLPSPPNRTACINRLEKLFEALASQTDFIEQAKDAWLPVALEHADVLARLLNNTHIPKPDSFSHDILQRMIQEKRFDQLASLPNNLNDQAFRRIQVFTQGVLKHRTVLSQAGCGFQVSPEDLQMIRSSFQWRTDPEQAEMLAYILLNLVKMLNLNWKTPIAYLVEALVYAGRIEDARKVCARETGLNVYFEGRRMDLDGFILRVKPIPRKDPIPEEYTLIWKNAV